MTECASCKPARFVALDGLRGVAALLVAIGHWVGGFPAYLAVDFFLLLSGFVLAYRYLYSGSVSYREFVIARLARLYPLHLLTLFAFAAVYLLRFRQMPHYADGDVLTFVANLLLLQNVGLITSELTWNAPSWSISVEFWVNLLFFALISTRTSIRMLIAIALAAFAMLALFQGSLAVSLPNYLGVFNSGIVRGVASFSLGIVAYRVHLQAQSSRRDLHGWGRELRVAILVCAALLVLVPRPGMGWVDFLAPPVFFATVVLFSEREAVNSRILRYAAYLGEISYSIYLVHYPVLQFMRYVREVLRHKHWDTGIGQLFVDPMLGLVPFLVLVLMISHFVYRWYEVPSKRWVRRLLSPAVPGDRMSPSSSTRNIPGQ